MKLYETPKADDTDSRLALLREAQASTCRREPK